MSSCWWFATLGVLGGCEGGPGEPGDPSVDSGDTDDVTTSDASMGLCADGGWGGITDARVAVHVREDGDDEGDGSVDAPLATLDAALELTRTAEELGGVAVGPGIFSAGLNLGGVGVLSKDHDDDGFAIEGCGVEETVLLAEDSDVPPIKATAVQDLRITDLTLDGGRRSLWIWGESTATVERVQVTNSSRVGVLISDFGTVVDLVDVDVVGVSPEGWSLGYGYNIANATVSLTGGLVSGATGVGILADHADLTLTEVVVNATERGAGDYLGRGVQLQGQSVATLMNCELTGNHDAAIYSSQSTRLDMDGIVIDGVYEAAVPDAEELSGDGIVVTGVDDLHDYLAEAFPTTLINSVISGTSRAGVLFEHVAAEASGNQLMNCELTDTAGTSMFSQDGAIVTGSDESVVLDETTNIQPLVLNRSLVETDTVDP